MVSINYINGLEDELYKANKRIEELTAPYEFSVNGRKEIVKELKDIKKILEDYQDQAITVEMKKVRVKTKKKDEIQF